MKYRVIYESLNITSGWFHTLKNAVERAKDTPLLEAQKFIEDESGEIVAMVVDRLVYAPISSAEIEEIDLQSTR